MIGRVPLVSLLYVSIFLTPIILTGSIDILLSAVLIGNVVSVASPRLECSVVRIGIRPYISIYNKDTNSGLGLWLCSESRIDGRSGKRTLSIPICTEVLEKIYKSSNQGVMEWRYESPIVLN